MTLNMKPRSNTSGDFSKNIGLHLDLNRISVSSSKSNEFNRESRKSEGQSNKNMYLSIRLSKFHKSAQKSSEKIILTT